LKDVYTRVLELREKETRRIIGLMSGTSADGITAALTEVSGTGEQVRIKLMGYKTIPYASEVKERVFNLFKPDICTVQDICEMNYVLGEAFAEAANHLMRDLGVSPEAVDLIGSHGQTIWHQPKAEPVSGYRAESTLQIGEPAVISEKTGILVVSDFRKADMAAGGEGAPLTPYMDYVLHRSPDENRVLQNIGGIANLTFQPAGAPLSDVVAFDTGPGNMIIDALVKKHTGASHDVDGGLASRGMVNKKLLSELLTHPYYGHSPPKTTGREVFGEEYSERVAKRALELNLSLEDLIATVTSLTVETIINAYRMLPESVDAVYVSGGGAKNPMIVKGLRNGLGVPVLDYSMLGFPGEAKEAVLVALLANENVMGTPCNVVSATGAHRQVVLGYPTWI
jgi:anhydro-N-acetylmuramic acid kinase